MARKKISEFTAKKILLSDLALPYAGMSFVISDETAKLEQLSQDVSYVIKVDEGIKKRMKKGLVSLNKKQEELYTEIKNLQKKGFNHFIIEPFIPHEQASEKYLSIERTKEGLQVLFAPKGGIDIEENQKTIQKIIIQFVVKQNTAVIPVKTGIHVSPVLDSRVRGNDKIREIAGALSLDESILEKLFSAFDKYHFSFLEINPLVVENGKVFFLDIAAEVDSAGEFFAHNAWSQADFRTGNMNEKTDEERQIDLLSQKSQASFTLNVLNPDGAIFMLLSGGGASIVMADEVYNVGFGQQLANYGEYSGNPNAQETYLYAKSILSLLLKSQAPKKVLIIGGGVANFTDIRITFKGLINALKEEAQALQEQHIKVFVRRGGPYQEEGLVMMEKFLKEKQLLGLVSDQTTALPEIIKMALNELSIRSDDLR